MTSALVLRSFSDELQKIAARRGVKMIGDMWGKAQKAFAAGDTQAGTALMERANKLSKTPGVVKPSAAGSQIKEIGRGSEGAVTAVADPQFGLSARKLYDPHGISTEELIKRKDIAGKALGKSEDVAEYYGQRVTPQRGGAMQFSELVPSAAGTTPRSIKAAPDYAAAKERAATAYRKATPYAEPQDVRAANMIRDARTGKLRTVDAIPGKPGEFLPQSERSTYGIRENILAPISEAGEAVTKNPGYQVSTPQLKRGLLGGGSPRTGAMSVPSRPPMGRPAVALQPTVKARPNAMRPAAGVKTIPNRPRPKLM